MPDFCERCYKVFLKEFHRKTRGAKNAYFHKESIVFRCKIPEYSIDLYGKSIVNVYDCKKGSMVTYSDEEYHRRRSMGEV
jgi:hypothetical protein